MTVSPRQFIDPHIHLWDLAVNDWYAFPVIDPPPSGDGIASFPTSYDFEDYRQDAGSTASIIGTVHVSAVGSPRHAAAETRWLSESADAGQGPDAIVGTLDIDATLADAEASLDRQASYSRFRGIRVLRGLDYDSAKGRDVLAMLAERGLLLDVVAHPGDGILEAASAARRNSDMDFVMEHTGWPMLPYDPSHFELWASDMRVFADAPNTSIKLSGLGMTHHTTDVPSFLRYFDAAIEMFGAHRCMFASNFPRDAFYGSFSQLFATFEAAARSLDRGGESQLFFETAARIYRIDLQQP